MAQPSPRPTRRLKKGAMLVQDEPRRSPTVLTVLVPCFNEAEILRETVAELTAYLDTGRWRKGPEGDWEILLVDDGSTDGSHSIMVDLAQRDGRYAISLTASTPAKAKPCRRVSRPRKGTGSSVWMPISTTARSISTAFSRWRKRAARKS